MHAHPSEKHDELKLFSANSICGIMAHTEDSAVASVGLPALRVAGECLTRRDQQNEFLDLLDQIRKETGWQISGWKDELMIVWERDSLSAEEMEPESPPSKFENSLQTPKTHPTTYFYVRALYDYFSEDQYRLNFNKGDLIQVYPDSGCWEGSLRGSTGWVSVNYCELISDDQKTFIEDAMPPRPLKWGLHVAKQKRLNRASAGHKAQKAARPATRASGFSRDVHKTLKKGLQKAQEAVYLYCLSRFSEAVDAYSETCELLQTLLELDTDQSVDQKRLEAIVSADGRQQGLCPSQADQSTSVIRILIEQPRLEVRTKYT